jgi:multimeric flavodoxin WrbA
MLNCFRIGNNSSEGMSPAYLEKTYLWARCFSLSICLREYDEDWKFVNRAKEVIVMRLLGLSCGRKMGNSEILLKEALMKAEEMGGIDVEIIRLHDLTIKPCTGCGACFGTKKPKPEACPIRDDVAFLWDRIMECDGLIVSLPVYILTPPGYYKVFCDRALHDVSFQMEMKKLGIETPGDERSFKPRAGAFIAVGGAPLPYWVSLGLPLMYCLTFPRQIEIVDQLQVLGAGNPGQVLLDEEAMKRAGKLGRHVAEAMGKLGKVFGEVKYMGDEPGTCPVCHTNLMVVGKESPIECAVCGIKGTIKVDNGKITVTFPEGEQKKSRLTLAGKAIHFYEIGDMNREFQRNKDKITQGMIDKYKSYKSYSLPPGGKA